MVPISMLALLCTLGGFFTTLALEFGVLAITGQNTALFAVLIIIFILPAIPCFYVAYILKWNFRLREAICWAQGKSVQAKVQWKNTSNPENAKLVFFKTNISSNVAIHVLRDGSQELWNTSGGEFREGLRDALGQAGLDGQIFNAGGFVTDSITNGAVAQNTNPPPTVGSDQHI